MSTRHAAFQAMSPAGLVIDTVTRETDRIVITALPAVGSGLHAL